jgi:hypothetical protein
MTKPNRTRIHEDSDEVEDFTDAKPSFATALISILVIGIVLFGIAFALACVVWLIASIISLIF